MELDFIGWDEDRKEIVDIHTIDVGAKYQYYTNITTSESERVKTEHIMQYTGLKDKNGIKIYQGYIVHDVRNDKYAEVKMNKFGRWSLYWSNWDRMNHYHGESFHPWLDIENGIKIVGNIYESPNLLK